MSFHYCKLQTYDDFNPEGIHINLQKIAEENYFFGFSIIYLWEYF